MIFTPSFLWALLGLILIASEMFISGFTIFFFGIGAVITGFITKLIPGMSDNFAFQGIMWIAFSVLSFSFLRKRFARIFKGTLLNRIKDQDVGNTAVVIEAITPDKPGRVRYQGTSWKAVSYTEKFDIGAKVDIIKEDNLTFVVSESILDNKE